jgi:hypothetical protein
MIYWDSLMNFGWDMSQVMDPSYRVFNDKTLWDTQRICIEPASLQ